MLQIAGMLLGAVVVTGVGAVGAGVDAVSGFKQQIESWRAQRVKRLTAPTGWLSLVGLPWLKEGANKIGSAPDNDVVIATAPAHLGVVTLARGKASIALDTQAQATIDGAKKANAELLDDSHHKPTTVAFGTTSFYLIERNGKYGLRVKDANAPTRLHFAGIDYFDIDPSWRIEAK